MPKLVYWFNQMENTNLKQFNTVIKTFMLHYTDILNYFNEEVLMLLRNPLTLKLNTLG